MKLRLKPKQEPGQEKQKELEPMYPTPERIEKLFNAWKNGGKEALVKALKEK